MTVCPATHAVREGETVTATSPGQPNDVPGGGRKLGGGRCQRSQLAWHRENARTLGAPWAATRMGVVATPTESPPDHARTPRGICGTRPGQSWSRSRPRPHPLADAHGFLALACRDRVDC